MATFRVVEKLSAPPEVVWQRLADVVAWPTWLPTVNAVTPLDRPSLDVGARFKIAQPKLRPAVWHVTSLSPGSGFIWESRAVGLHMWANHSVRQAGPGASEVELEFRFAGLLAPLVALLMGKLTEEYLRTEAASLKATVEVKTIDTG